MKIPTNREQLTDLAPRAKAGLAALGATLNVAHNTEARLTTDIHNFVGEPGSLINIGAQGQYNKQQVALTNARAARNAARLHARQLCVKAVDALIPHLGRRWNPQWTAAGFGGFSLEVTNTNVAARLLGLRNYFRSNPAHEVAAEGITEAAFEAEIAALQAAEHARDAAISDFRDARDARNAAQEQLRSRLSGLQEELGRLLSPSDNRWADFGFPRPIDGSIPERVEGLTLTPGLPGSVLAQWADASRALNYRVSWTPQVSGGVTTEVGLFADLAVTLSGLPSGLAITVSVTARNNAGETQPTIATIVVP